ncbi:MAG: pyridoxal phosphate-dependent aminotransferase [Candidatus Ancaeobacter aquaticus]|nr:pyridoxal phosphate-dependent aminotransferase [Candidatus Ancaeobacter aquaticus]
MFAERMKKIDSSGIRKVFELAKNMKDPINLSIGQPDFDVPDILKNEAVKAIESGFNKYTVTQGIDPLRKNVEKELDKKGIFYESSLITSGVSGGLLLAFMALIDPGDEVIIADPYFVMYTHLVSLMGGVPRYVDTYPHFRLLRSDIEKNITKKTKLIIINSPSNPTGTVYTREELTMVADLAREHGIIVLSDEIYDTFTYDGDYTHMGSLYNNTITLNGFSKSYSMTGWRIGYAAGPKDIIAEMTKLQQYTFVCAPSFAQKAAVNAFDFSMEPYIEDYKKKRDIVYNGLKDAFTVEKPHGAFYIFPEAPDGNASRFVERAIDNNVLIIPGNVFSQKDTHFRISYAVNDETLKRGVDQLNALREKVESEK